MNGQFSLGEIALAQKFAGAQAIFNDKDVEVVGPLDEYMCRHPDVPGRYLVFGYEVQFPDGHCYIVNSYHLRKKPRPATDTGETRILELFHKAPVVSPVEQQDEMPA